MFPIKCVLYDTYMTSAVDKVDGRGLINTTHSELLPRKTKVMLY